MKPALHDKMSSITVNVGSGDENTTISRFTQSVPEGCGLLRVNESQYIPWDNPDNIVSAKVEEIVDRLKEVFFIPILFLIGVPANIMNMAVFYKQGLKDRVNLCLFALSFADCVYLTSYMILFGEQLHLQFTNTVERRFGPIETFMVNYNLNGFFGFCYVSQILSAIIASERCFCVLSPLKAQTLLRTRTMAIFIMIVYIVVLGLYFVVVFKFNIGCLYDPITDIAYNTPVIGEFYSAHMELIDYLYSFVYGVVIPGVVIIVVITTTIVTSVKLHQIVTWRTGTSSSISAQEIALTKMLIGNSIFFIACVSPVGVFHFVFLFFKEINIGGRQHNFFMTIHWALDVLTFINSTFNFFVYYAMGSRYRETFWGLFRRKKKADRL